MNQLHGVFFKMGIIDHPIHQPLGQGFVCAEDSAFEQELKRRRASDQLQQALHFMRGHWETQLVDGYAKPRRPCREPNVTLASDFQATPNAHALYLRDYGMHALRDRPKRRRNDVEMIISHAGKVGPLTGKLADVGAGGKIIMCAAQHNAAQARVTGQPPRCR